MRHTGRSVVRKIVDVGPDPASGRCDKVLLDGVTPAWGVWKQNEEGVPQFEVHQTQSFPGLEEPAEGPLPGDYDLQLVSDSSPTGLSAKDITVIVAAALAAAVGLGAIVLTSSWSGAGGHCTDVRSPAAAAICWLGEVCDRPGEGMMRTLLV